MTTEYSLSPEKEDLWTKEFTIVYLDDRKRFICTNKTLTNIQFFEVLLRGKLELPRRFLIIQIYLSVQSGPD